MTALNYVTVTGTFDDGSGSPVNGTVTFTPSATVYASGTPVVSAGTPVSCSIAGGQLQGPSGGTLQLLATDNDVTVEGRTGFWFWSVAISIDGATDGWDFFLSSAPSPVDLYSLAGTPAP